MIPLPWRAPPSSDRVFLTGTPGSKLCAQRHWKEIITESCISAKSLTSAEEGAGCETGKVPESNWHIANLLLGAEGATQAASGVHLAWEHNSRVGAPRGARSALECARPSAALGVGSRCRRTLVVSITPANRVFFLVGKSESVRRLPVKAAGDPFHYPQFFRR